MPGIAQQGVLRLAALFAAGGGDDPGAGRGAVSGGRHFSLLQFEFPGAGHGQDTWIAHADFIQRRRALRVSGTGAAPSSGERSSETAAIPAMKLLVLVNINSGHYQQQAVRLSNGNGDSETEIPTEPAQRDFFGSSTFSVEYREMFGAAALVFQSQRD